MMCINGLIPRFFSGEIRGEIWIDDLNVSECDFSEISERVGTVFQNPETQILMTDARSEVSFALENLGFPADRIENSVRNALSFFELPEGVDPSDLSDGQKQRLSLACALALNPKVLILDEPTSNLDPLCSNMLTHALGRVSNLGATIILAEHRPDRIINHVGRVLVMDEGRIVEDGCPLDVLRKSSELGIRTPQLMECSKKIGLASLSIEEIAGVLRKKYKLNEAEQELVARSHGEPVVSLDDVYFSYDDEDVIKGISLSIDKGEFIALIGPNGSGKTTLALLILGIIRPKSGAIVVDGLRTDQAPLSAITERVGYVFQNPDYQMINESVWAEVASSRVEDLKVEEVLKYTDLWHHRDRHPHTLSLGEKRRLSLAVALARDPDVLILDEPTIGQDLRHNEKFMHIIVDLKRKGMTVILITHDVETATKYAERVLFMSNGKVILDGPTRDVFSKLGNEWLPQVCLLSRMLGSTRAVLTEDELSERLAAL